MENIDWNQLAHLRHLEQLYNTKTATHVVKPAALTVGFIYFARALYYIAIAINLLIKVYILPNIKRINLKKKYGTYVVMTNVTDVMSEAFAIAFARQGFSLVLVTVESKEFDEFKPKIEKILEENGGKLKVILKDITKSDDDIYKEVQKELDNSEYKGEIGILMNNGGMIDNIPGNFLELTNKNVLDAVHRHVIDFLMVTKAVLKVMYQNHRGLIVNVTSPQYYVVSERFEFSNSLKQFVDEFSKTIEEEFAKLPSINVEVFNPGCILSSDQQTKSSVFYPTPSEYVKSAMPKLGTTEQTAGYWTHSLFDTIKRCTPQFIQSLVNWIMKKLMSDSNLQGYKQIP